MLKDYPIDDFLITVTPIPGVLGDHMSLMTGYGFNASIIRADGRPVFGRDLSVDASNCISYDGPYENANVAVEGGLAWAKQCISALMPATAKG